MEKSKINPIKWPVLLGDEGSLTVLEKSILGNFIILSDAKVILEFGSFKGVTTKFMVDFCQINQLETKIFAFDIPEVTSKLSKIPELEEAIASGMLTFVGGYLPHSLIQWKEENKGLNVDLVLDDAMHSYKSVWQELNLVLPILSNGGFILCHDYSYKYEGVRLAINKFAKRKGLNIQPLVSKNTFSNESNTKIIHKSVLVSLSKKSSFLESNFKEELFVRKYYLKQFLARTELWKLIRRYIRK